jgi:hypothetical protein
MLRLKLVGSDVGMPPDPPNDAVQIWRGHDGGIFSYAYSASGRHWMRVPGVGSFGFLPGSDEVVAAPEGADRPHLVHDIYRRVVLPMALQALGREALHASAIRASLGVFALCGDSQTGKSTTAYALSRRGYDLWADDAVVVEIGAHAIKAIPVPFTARLRPRSAEFFGVTSQPPPGPPANVGDDRESEALAGIFVLKRETDLAAESGVEIRRLVATEAFPAVLTHATCFNLHDVERKRRMVEQYVDLTARVPVFEVRFLPGFHRLGALVHEIEEIAAALTTEQALCA